ncbi:MAG: gliding motility lipoprotein GldH [Bacteroidales bacterium]|nr:gliding motility lipoprotein GldH [Bacteroidales bacterium]
MPGNRNIFAVAALIMILTSSCGRDIVFTDSSEMPSATWSIGNVSEFDIVVSDTVTANDIFFTIRTGTSYPYRNIYLFVTTTSPDEKRLTDTLQYYLADEKGKWYGKGFGDVRELLLPFKTNVFFPLKGTYQIRVQHGMRIKDLRGVYDFGIRVEKINKPV